MNRPSLLALIAGVVAALPAAAQFQKPEDAIKYRQSAMFLQGQTFGRVAAMANGKVPFDAKVMNDNIALVDTLNHLQFAAFVDGSDKGAKTQAKPEIWSQRDKFDAAAKRSQEDVAKLVAAGKSGNLDQIKAAAGAVGKSCKACHDDFSTM
ncbi:MAG TPA: cytochrome c [Rubrivivax sp.]|nr:cytochrome c [Rubrivivax sp.]